MLINNRLKMFWNWKKVLFDLSTEMNIRTEINKGKINKNLYGESLMGRID